MFGLLGAIASAAAVVTGKTVSGVGEAVAAGGNGRDLFSGTGSILKSTGDSIASLGASPEGGRDSVGTLSMGSGVSLLGSMPDFKGMLSAFSLPKSLGGQEQALGVSAGESQVVAAVAPLPEGVIHCDANDICVPAGLPNYKTGPATGMAMASAK